MESSKEDFVDAGNCGNAWQNSWNLLQASWEPEGLYEIRVQAGGTIYHIFCFFDKNDLVVVGHGFQKKTQKTPQGELDKAEKIKKQYYEEKKSHKP